MPDTIFKQLAELSHAVRKHSLVSSSNITPLSVLTDFVKINGRSLKRTRVVLLAKPCKVGTCSMCPYPEEGLKQNHADADILAQVKASLDYSGKCSVLTLFHNGNFFMESEISPELRRAIYMEVKKAGYTVFSVESLPQTISEEKIKEFKMYLPAVTLEVAMGVQSMHTQVRRYCTVSPFTHQHLLNAFSLLKKYGYTARAFLMFGQPFLTTAEALSDTVMSALALQKCHGVDNIVICPIGVAPNTLAQTIQFYTNWKPPGLLDVFTLLSILITKELNAKIAINTTAQQYIEDISIFGGLNKVLDVFKRYNEESVLKEEVLIYLEKNNVFLPSSSCMVPSTEVLQKRAASFLENYHNDK